MRKNIPLFLFLLVLLCSGIRKIEKPIPVPPADQTEVTVSQTQPTTQPTTPIPETTLAAQHSALYLPGVDVEDVITYFEEVCLDAEFVNGGDPSVLQRWEAPIVYRIYGEPTQEDLLVLTGFADWLNTLEGFPGIRPAEDGEYPNCRIHFCSANEMRQILGENFADMDGGVTFWYDENVIFDASICYRTDLDQITRNSVILEELYNGLGPIQDTWLRPDSIIYAEYTTPQALTIMDELILKLLYSPQLRCGMTVGECREAIRLLYY